MSDLQKAMMMDAKRLYYFCTGNGISGSYAGWYNNIQPATTGWSSKANDGWSNKKTKVDMASDIQAALSQMEEKLCISSGQFHILYEPTKAHHTRKGAGPQRPKFFTPKISFVLFDLQRPNLSSWDSGKASCGLSTIAELTVSSVTPCLLSVTADDERPLLNNVSGLHEIM